MANGAPVAVAPRDPGQFARYRTQMREQPEDIWQPVYDRVNYASTGAFELIFFSQPIGASVTLLLPNSAPAAKVKTRRDTNLEQQGVIPTKAYKIHGFSLTIVPQQQLIGGANTPNIVDDVLRLLYGGFMEFRIVDKPYIYLPLHKIPATGQLRGAVATTATATTMVSAPGGGTGAPRDIYWIGVPLTLDPYQNFSLRMQFDGSPALSQSYDLQFFFEGYMRRPGQ